MAAFSATCKKRNSTEIISKSNDILAAIKRSDALLKQWVNYSASSYYVENLDWLEVIGSVYELAEMLEIIQRS